MKVFKAFIAVAIGAATLISCKPMSQQKTSHNEAFANIMTRKSVRSYANKPIEKEKVDTLLRAAMAAPTAVNKQPWAFVVIDDAAILDTLAAHLPYAKMTGEAPLAVVVCGDLTKTIRGNDDPYWALDCSAATENLLLAAESMGLGAVWTGVYPNEQLYPKLHDYLGLPETVQPFCAIPVGYPAGDDKPKDKWKPENIHYGKW